MNPRVRFALLILGVNLLLLPSLIFGDDAETIRARIDQQQAQIEALNKEIAAYEKQLQTIGNQKQTLQNALSSLDLTIKKTGAQIKSTQTSISSLELEIDNLNGDIANKEGAIEVDSQAIAQMVRQIYESDQASMFEVILSNQSVSDIWNQTDTMHALQGAMHAHVIALSEVKQELTIDRDETEKKKKELESKRRTLAAEQESLGVAKREQQSLLNITKSQESSYQKLLEEKREAREQFEQSLNELESQLQYTLDPNKIPAAGKGILRWPLDSVKITQYFGNTAFANSGAYSGKGHNGIDFRAAIGTPVRASLQGEVIGAGNTDTIRGCYSYGKWVLIRHANGLSSLYAHLSQINVSRGETVDTGQVIGYSGNTGYSTGPHLHFSVYASGAVQVRKLNSGLGCNDAVIPVSATSGYLNPLDYL